MTRKELTAALNRVELSILSGRDLTNLEHVREVKRLLFEPQTESELGDQAFTAAELDALATAVEGKLP